jgi:hypothetical protein
LRIVAGTIVSIHNSTNAADTAAARAAPARRHADHATSPAASGRNSRIDGLVTAEMPPAMARQEQIRAWRRGGCTG